MDLLSESTSGTRVLTTRHISPERALLQESKSVNTTLLCHSYSLQPHIATYISALQPYVWALWTCGFLILLATCVLYLVTLKSASKHWRDCLLHVSIVLAVYPVVTASGLIALVVPRARLISEALAQQAVMVAMYHMFCMIVREAGGRDKFIRIAGDSRLETRVLPCCCWPCCLLPRPKFNKRALTWLRYLVLQMPVVQGLLYVTILILWAEDINLYLKSFIYIQPFVVISIISGVWGIIMCVRAAEATGMNPRPRFLAIQFSLLIVKIQCGIAKVLPEMISIPCIVALHPAVIVHLIQNFIMMIEMLALSIWAWRLYRLPTGNVVIQKVHQVVVAVIDDGISDKPSKDDDTRRSTVKAMERDTDKTVNVSNGMQ